MDKLDEHSNINSRQFEATAGQVDTNRLSNMLRKETKYVKMQLKQIVTDSTQDKLLESGKVYELKVYPSNIPLYQKIRIDRPNVQIYRKKIPLKPSDESDSEMDSSQLGLKKNDLKVYISLFNRRPNPENKDTYDYVMRGKEIYLNLQKNIQFLRGGVVYLAFYS